MNSYTFQCIGFSSTAELKKVVVAKHRCNCPIGIFILD